MEHLPHIYPYVIQETLCTQIHTHTHTPSKLFGLPGAVGNYFRPFSNKQVSGNTHLSYDMGSRSQEHTDQEPRASWFLVQFL